MKIEMPRDKYNKLTSKERADKGSAYLSGTERIT